MKCLKSFHTKGYGQLVAFDCIHWDRASRHRYHDGITGNKPLGKKAYDSYSEKRNIMIRLLNIIGGLEPVDSGEIYIDWWDFRTK